MKVLALALGLVVFSGRSAGQLVVAGPGGAIESPETGLYPGSLPPVGGTSEVVLPENVQNVVSVTIHGLDFFSARTLQVTLEDPTGVEHNLILPLEYYELAGLSYDDVDIEVVEWGAEYGFPDCGAGQAPCAPGDPVSGTYDQVFSSGPVLWGDGWDGVLNTPLCSLSGPSGVWRLRFYDYDATAVGSFDGWTLKYNGLCRSGGEGAFCGGGGEGVPCPCANDGGSTLGVQHGCVGSGNWNSFPFSIGGVLLGLGGPSRLVDDQSYLVTSGMPDFAPVLLFYGSERRAPTPLGAGLLCVGGSVRRLLTTRTGDSGGVILGPGLAALSGAVPGEAQHYQVLYRDVGGPCPGATTNLTNGWTLRWH